MALELESKIMSKIGLGPHYDYFNGSGACFQIRRRAATRIAKAIQKYHELGEHIAKPDTELVDLLMQVAETESSQYSLTNTWQAAADIIRTHMELANETEEARKKEYEFVKDYIKQRYMPTLKADYSNIFG